MMRGCVGIVVVAICFGIAVADVQVQILEGQQAAGDGELALPADVHPESRNRLAGRPADSRDTAAGVAAIQLRGTGNARWTSPLGRRLTELAILITGREHDQPFEWSLHELEAIAVGLDPAVIDVVRNRRPLTGLGEQEAVIIQLGRELFVKHELTSETYARAVTLLGESNLVDLVGLMARYSGIAVRLTAFNQHMPPDWLQLLRCRSRSPMTFSKVQGAAFPY